MQAAIKKLAAGGGNHRRNNPNKNSNNLTTNTKGVVTVYRQWNKYCHACGVVLYDKRGCGTECGKDCLFKKEGHKNEATFTNKMGGNTRRNHFWNLWCEPETNKKISILPAGAKTQK